MTTPSTSGTPAPRSGPINASNPCVTGDTRVLTPGGIWRRIDQMIHLPSRVITSLEGQEIHATEGAFPTGTQEVYELRTAGGYTVTLTADHKLWTAARLGRRQGSDPPTTKSSSPAKPPPCRRSASRRTPSSSSCSASSSPPPTPATIQSGSTPAWAASELIEPLVRYAAHSWSERVYDDDYVNQLMVTDDDAARPEPSPQR